jgi:glucan phosphorylase
MVWKPEETIVAVAYDTPVPGYETYNVLNIRLWSARPSKEFDLHHFNRGDFYKSIEEKQNSEHITSVLYPNDNTEKGISKSYYYLNNLSVRRKGIEIKTTIFLGVSNHSRFVEEIP